MKQSSHSGASLPENDHAGIVADDARPSLWKTTDYGPWLVADTSGTLGASMAGFAIPLIVLAVTGSAAQASLVSAVQSCVSAATNIPGGLLQDRCDRRMLLLIWSATGVLLFGGAGLLGRMGWLGVAGLMVLAILLGLRSGLLGNTSNAMLRGVVPDRELARAMSLNSARDAVINLASDPISGMLMHMGNTVPLLSGAVMNVISMIGAWRIRRYWKVGDDDGNGDGGDGGRHGGPSGSTVRKEMEIGWRVAFSGMEWLFRWPFQRCVIIASMAFNGSINALLLITQMQVTRQTGSTFVAAMVGTIGSVGMLIGAAAAAGIIDRLRGGIIICLSFWLMAVGSFGVALMPNVWGKGLLLFVGLLMLPAGNAVAGGYLSILVSKGNQGRLSAAQTLCGMGAYALLTAAGGVMMDRFGYTTAALALAGIMGIAALIVSSNGVLRSIPKPDAWQGHIERCGLQRF